MVNISPLPHNDFASSVESYSAYFLSGVGGPDVSHHFESVLGNLQIGSVARV